MKVAEGNTYFPFVLYAFREKIQIGVKDVEPQKKRASGFYYSTPLVRREKDNVLSGIRSDNSVTSNRFMDQKSTSTFGPSTSFTGNEFEQGQIWG